MGPKAEQRVCGEPRGDAKNGRESDSVWAVSNQANANCIEVKGIDTKTALFVSDSHHVTVMVKNKCKAVMVENCANLTLCVEEPVLSSVDIANSKKIIFHAVGQTKLVQVDKSDGVEVFVHPGSEDIRVAHSVAQNMNISRKDNKDDWVETAIPTAFVAAFDDKGKLKTEVSDLYK